MRALFSDVRRVQHLVRALPCQCVLSNAVPLCAIVCSRKEPSLASPPGGLPIFFFLVLSGPRVRAPYSGGCFACRQEHTKFYTVYVLIFRPLGRGQMLVGLMAPRVSDLGLASVGGVYDAPDACQLRAARMLVGLLAPRVSGSPHA